MEAEQKKEQEEKKPAMVACCNCVFFDGDAKMPLAGLCLAEPPKLFPVQRKHHVNGFRPTSDVVYQPVYPQVTFDKFCRHFAPARDIYAQCLEIVEQKQEKESKVKLV